LKRRKCLVGVGCGGFVNTLYRVLWGREGNQKFKKIKTTENVLIAIISQQNSLKRNKI
jgi:hypothetical protein